MMEVAGLFYLNDYYYFYSFLSYFSVPQETFVEYITTSDDYKNNFDRAVV
jgi:hypothetical protein